jgi:exopolysaccharide biosynthesis polyprenyl glycosylphosphotransferase
VNSASSHSALRGYRREADRLIELIANRPDLGMRVCALAGDWETAFKHNLEWLGQPGDAVGTLNATGATGVVMSPAGMPGAEFNGVAQALARRGVPVYCSTGLREVGHGRLRPAALANESFYTLAPPELSRWQLLAKRAMDLSIASTVVLFSGPVMLLLAAAIKVGDRGPVFFRQVRVGRHGKTFTVYKFRTMVVNAEARLAEVQSQNARTGPLFKAASDPRITQVGRILRATSLDELPQLFNVLNGTMSLVGPRPALPAEVATFDERHLERHKLPPGVTGLWQVEARDNPSFQAYRHLDVFYVENWSCGLDLVLLWNTVPAIAARALRSLLHGQDIVADATDPQHEDGTPATPVAPVPMPASA